MSEDFGDRLQIETYGDDEPVHVFRCDRLNTDASHVWIPETIWHRLRYLGSAYGLHLLPLLDGTTDPLFLNPLQSDELLREVCFVSEIVSDPLVQIQVTALMRLAAEPSQGTSKDMFRFEFP